LDTGHCGSIDHVARREIYPLLKKWFGIPLPSQEDQSIEIDSQYGPDRPDYPLVKFKESQRRMPDKELVCINPEVNAGLDRRALHEIAWQRGAQLLETARNKRANRDRDWRRQDLIGGLSEVLGDVEPPAAPKVEQLWSRKMSEVEVEGLIVHPEAGVFVPLLLFKPGRREAKSQPLVLAVAEGGKDRFLKHRSQEIVALLEAGIAVCLPDLRGTGETAADQYKTQSHDQLYSEIALGNTLVGLRLKDVRTVLAYLRKRENLDSKRFAIWGDSFAVPNETEIWVDELARTPVSPQIQHMGSPLGSVLALLAALYEPEIAAVAVRGGLISYLSLLESPFVYVPFDISVPEILREGDVPDICAALAPVPLLMEQLIGGRNFVVQPGELVRKMAMASESYEREGASARLIIRSTVREPGLDDWLVEQLVQ
jgi:hypothetical protein